MIEERYILPDGTPLDIGGFNPFFVLDTAAKTIRLPDTRNMIMTDAGSFIAVGGAQSDAIRPITGNYITRIPIGSAMGNSSPIGVTDTTFTNGVFAPFPGSHPNASYFTSTTSPYDVAYGLTLDVSRQVPVANEIRPKRFGSLGCVYIGKK
jgi:hypothetical protein